MLERPKSLWVITKKSCLGLFLGVSLWTALLIHGAVTLRSSGQMGGYDIRLGTVTLNTIYKQPVDEGFVVSFVFYHAFYWYLLVCTVAGGGWGCISAWRQQTAGAPKPP